jgi:hypothetical protein
MRLGAVRNATDTSSFAMGSDDEACDDAHDCSMFVFDSDGEDCGAESEGAGLMRGSKVAARHIFSPLASSAGPSSNASSYTPSSNASSSDGRGKYSRADGKGSHMKWDDRAHSHLIRIADHSWLDERPCGRQCSFGQHCFSRITENDARDCAAYVFGTTDPAQSPSVTHGEATQLWFNIIYAGRVVDATTRSVVGIAYRLTVASGVEVCSGAARALYAAPNTTWDAMASAVMAGDTNWKERVTIGARSAQKWSETKKNDATVWWLDRIKQCGSKFEGTSGNSIEQRASTLLLFTTAVHHSSCFTP